VHPLVGPKKDGDYLGEVILKSYEMMILNGYLEGKIFLSAFQSYPRYCGPREAIFTAICRKNFGCSHFIVGRDHSGVGGYYEADSAMKLFNSLGDIGIKPIFFDNINYCKKCKSYISECIHGEEDLMAISGNEGRRMLKKGINPPEWFIRKEISNFILERIKNNMEVFVKEG
jgi:ATP sulfurylase